MTKSQFRKEMDARNWYTNKTNIIIDAKKEAYELGKAEERARILEIIDYKIRNHKNAGFKYLLGKLKSKIQGEWRNENKS